MPVGDAATTSLLTQKRTSVRPSRRVGIGTYWKAQCSYLSNPNQNRVERENPPLCQDRPTLKQCWLRVMPHLLTRGWHSKNPKSAQKGSRVRT